MVSTAPRGNLHSRSRLGVLTLTFALRPYQEDGVAFLMARRRALLTDVPRLGKTAQVLVAACRLGLTRASVVGPASVRDVWPYERDRCAPNLALSIQSYGEAVNDGVPDAPLIVFDEFHRMKSPGSARSKLLIQTRKAERVWALSGTPTPNGTYELFTLAASMWPAAVRALGITSEADWWNRYAIFRPGKRGRKYLGAKNTAELRAFFRDRALGRKWSDVWADVQPVEWVTQWLAPVGTGFSGMLPPDMEDVLTFLDTQPANISALRHQVGLQKVDASLRVLLDALHDSDEQIVVAYHHRDVGDILQANLSVYSLARIDGRTPLDLREEFRRQFQAGGTRVLLGQSDAIREGIDLSAANVLHIIEPSWTPGYNEQVGLRIARPDKTDPCMVVTHVLADTLDESILRVLERKEHDRHQI